MLWMRPYCLFGFEMVADWWKHFTAIVHQQISYLCSLIFYKHKFRLDKKCRKPILIFKGRLLQSLDLNRCFHLEFNLLFVHANWCVYECVFFVLATLLQTIIFNAPHNHHPGPFSLSAANVILGKPDFHYLCFLLAMLQLISPGISYLLIQAYGGTHSLDDLHSSTLSVAWGNITILMLHSHS